MKTPLLIALLLLSISATAQLSNDSLLAYYPFNGSVNDMSGNGYNGVPNGTSYTADCDQMGNSALLFDGINDYVDLSSFASAFRDHLDTMTIFFKIRFDKTTTNQTIISLGSDGENLQTNVFEVEHENNRMQIETEAPNGVINHHNNEYGVDSSAENPLFDNACHEIMITLLQDTLTYYRDGTLLFKNEYVPTQTTSTNMFLGTYSGSLTSPCCYFGGMLDELQFYNRILDISETQGNVSVADINTLQGISVYPNPSTGELVISSEKLYQDAQIQVYDFMGRKVLSKEFNSTLNTRINLPEASGIYSIRVVNGENKTFTTKIVRK